MDAAALTFTAIDEPLPSAARIHALLPALLDWYLRDGDAARPTYSQARRALQEHMPELFPTWEALTSAAGGGDLAARVLSLYDPPPLLAGCSQAVIDGALVRNYDYHPDRIEGDRLQQRDHAAGARDERLPVGTARRHQRRRAGGRAGVRRAPGARRRLRDHARRPLPAGDVRHGRAGLSPRSRGCRSTRRTTSRSRTRRDAATVYVGPDRAARVVVPAVATNHQEHVDWPEHAAATRSVERRDGARDRHRGRLPRAAALRDRVLARLRHALHRGLSPASAPATYRWPGERWDQSLAAFTPGTRTVRLRERADRHVGAGPR